MDYKEPTYWEGMLKPLERINVPTWKKNQVDKNITERGWNRDW